MYPLLSAHYPDVRTVTSGCPFGLSLGSPPTVDPKMIPFGDIQARDPVDPGVQGPEPSWSLLGSKAHPYGG